MEPEHIKFPQEQIEEILSNDGLMDVELEEGVYKYSL